MKIFIAALVAMLAISSSLGGQVSARAPLGAEVMQAAQATATVIPPTPAPTSAPTASAPSKFVKQTVSLGDLGYSGAGDETVQGVLVSRTYGIRWPGTWIVKPGNSVTIEYSHPQNLASYSGMAVDFNGVRIGSVSFTPENANHGILKLSIPENVFKEGYNSLSLQFSMGIHDNYCDDIQNPGVWATIHGVSSFDLAYEKAPAVPDLALYPYPLLQKSDLFINQVTIITPDKPSLSELKAVAMISAKLGQLNSFFEMNLTVVPESAMSSPASVKGNVIFVGLAKNLKTINSAVLPFIKNAGFVGLDGKTLNADDGILWEDVSPGDASAVRLMVTGQNDAALEKAAQALANDGVYVRLKGQLGVISQTPEVLPAPKAKTSMTLEDLGYTDQTASGTSRQNINYVLPLAGEWKVATEAAFNLHFAHSALLYPQGSAVTVLVNDTPAGSAMLTAENTENGQLSIKIPARLFTIGDNTLTVTTDSQLTYNPQDQYFCNKDGINEAWVTVFADSSLKLPDGPSSLVLDLKNYPAGFIGATDFSDLSFVVPDAPDWTSAQAIAWIASRLGKNSSSPEFIPGVVKASDNTAEKASTYQILIGEPSKNPAIFQLNAILPMPFTQGQNTLQNPAQIAQFTSASGSSSIGYIQSSITDKNQPRLVVTGSNSEGVLWAAKALYDPASVGKLKGDIAVLDSATSVYSTTSKKPIVAEIETAQTVVAQTPLQAVAGTSTSWVLWLSGGLFLLTLLIIIIFTLVTVRKKNK
jgi:hypothetical protein